MLCYGFATVLIKCKRIWIWYRYGNILNALSVLLLLGTSIALAEDTKWLITTEPVEPVFSPDATEIVLGVNYATDPQAPQPLDLA